MKQKVKELQLHRAPEDVLQCKGGKDWWKESLEQHHHKKSMENQTPGPHENAVLELTLLDQYWPDVLHWDRSLRKTAEGRLCSNKLAKLKPGDPVNLVRKSDSQKLGIFITNVKWSD